MSTEQIHEAVVTVGKAVESLNVTLAKHAAWTDERFENVLGELSKIAARMDRVLNGPIDE